MQKPVVNVMVKAARAAGGVLLRNMNRLDAINVIEADLQAAFPQVRWVFFEPDVPRV